MSSNEPTSGPFDVEMPDAMVFHDDDSAVELRNVDRLKELVPPEPRPIPQRPQEEFVDEWTPGGSRLQRWKRKSSTSNRSGDARSVRPLLGTLAALAIIVTIFVIAYLIFTGYIGALQPQL